MSNFSISGQVSKVIMQKRRSRSFWNVFFAVLLLLLFAVSSYFIYQMCVGEIGELGPFIALLAIFVCPLIIFCIFMLVITNIKNPSKRIEKIQRKYMLRFYK